MKIHEISTGSKKATKRLGRGIGSGSGKTAGRGTKGQNSRTGGGVKIGFEGGQTKLSRRLPKARGFTARNKVQYQVITLDQIEAMKSTTVTNESLQKAGLADTKKPTKLLAQGNLSKRVAITVDKASQSAIDAVQKVGGNVTQLTAPRVRKSTKPTKSGTIPSTKAK